MPGLTVRHYQLEGESEWTEITLDSNGEGTLTPPSGYDGVTFSDLNYPRPHSAFVCCCWPD